MKWKVSKAGKKISPVPIWMGDVSVCLCVCLSAHLPTCLPAHVPACPPAACLPSCIPACLPARLPTCPPARLPACPPAHLPTCLHVCLSIRPSVHWKKNTNFCQYKTHQLSKTKSTQKKSFNELCWGYYKYLKFYTSLGFHSLNIS